MSRANFTPAAVIVVDILAAPDMRTYTENIGVPASFFNGWITLSPPAGKGPL
jgi:hypothetical protein